MRVQAVQQARDTLAALDESSGPAATQATEAEQLRDTIGTLQTIVNRVREAVATDQPAPAPVGLRERLRTVLGRFIDPDDDCMPALSDDGHGFTWIPTDSVLDELEAAVAHRTGKPAEETP